MKISIITVTLNNKAGLLRAIESVCNQTYKNVEHIIVDGGSTDGTIEILKQDLPNGSQVQNDIPDSKLPTNNYSLITISEKDNGIYDAINKGIKLATGDVIGLLHSDDFYADEFVLEKYAEAFYGKEKRIKEKDKSIISSREDARYIKDFSVVSLNRKDNGFVEAVYSDLVYVREKSKVKSQKSKVEDNENSDNYLHLTDYSVIRTWKTHPSHFDYAQCDTLRMTKWIKNGWMPPHPTLFLRKEVFEKYGLYRTDMEIAADYEMILRLFYKHKISSHYLPVTTYLMTIGGASNKSLRNIFIKSSEDLKAMKMHKIPFPFYTLFCKNFSKIRQFF
jgi:glycosyltransferase